MPNYFDFLIYADERTIQTKKIRGKEKNVLSEGIRNLLQTYAKGINNQNNSNGSLFQQNTKAKCLSIVNNSLAVACFNYIHQNPMKENLVTKMEYWNYSSFQDYLDLRNGTLCNKKLAFELLNLNRKTFYENSYNIIRDEKIEMIFDLKPSLR